MNSAINEKAPARRVNSAICFVYLALQHEECDVRLISRSGLRKNFSLDSMLHNSENTAENALMTKKVAYGNLLLPWDLT